MKDENTELNAMTQDENPILDVLEQVTNHNGNTAEADVVDASDEVEESFNLKRKLTNAAVSCALVLAILLCVAVLSQVLSKGYVSVGRYSLFRVVTGSMEPAIPVGSLLVSQKADIEEIQLGDIVNFRSKDMGMLGITITHRVVNILINENGQILLETKEMFYLS